MVTFDAFDIIAFLVFAMLIAIAVIVAVTLGQLPGQVAMTPTEEVKSADCAPEACRTPSTGIEGALLRIGTSTGGSAAVGAVIGTLFLPGIGTFLGMMLGGAAGLSASTHEVVKTSKK